MPAVTLVESPESVGIATRTASMLAFPHTPQLDDE